MRLRGPPEDDERLPGTGNDEVDSSSNDDDMEFDSGRRMETPGGFPESRASSGQGTGYF